MNDKIESICMCVDTLECMSCNLSFHYRYYDEAKEALETAIEHLKDVELTENTNACIDALRSMILNLDDSEFYHHNKASIKLTLNIVIKHLDELEKEEMRYIDE